MFDSRFMKFIFRISPGGGGDEERVGITFWDPVEDTDTSGPSLITVRMEYVFAFYLLFNTDIVDFWPKFLYSNLI